MNVREILVNAALQVHSTSPIVAKLRLSSHEGARLNLSTLPKNLPDLLNVLESYSP